MNVRFALAVSSDKQFEKRHFGDADKYLIYEHIDDKLMFLSEEVNGFKDMDETKVHGSQRKGHAIIEFLKSKKVNVLVSRQFGKNIKMVNQHFIPVIITTENSDDVLEILNHHIHWIEDEWGNNKQGFKLFKIKAGILKASIDK
ncbi:MAG: hypothetical protein DRJ02_02300 [Bacteroidetes bacterium]|nr:MAG: hypothetical protein DRJ02_02300 [Bacteroidota bacterium]